MTYCALWGNTAPLVSHCLTARSCPVSTTDVKQMAHRAQITTCQAVEPSEAVVRTEAPSAHSTAEPTQAACIAFPAKDPRAVSERPAPGSQKVGRAMPIFDAAQDVIGIDCASMRSHGRSPRWNLVHHNRRLPLVMVGHSPIESCFRLNRSGFCGQATTFTRGK